GGRRLALADIEVQADPFVELLLFGVLPENRLEQLDSSRVIVTLKRLEPAFVQSNRLEVGRPALRRSRAGPGGGGQSRGRRLNWPCTLIGRRGGLWVVRSGRRPPGFRHETPALGRGGVTSCRKRAVKLAEGRSGGQEGVDFFARSIAS